MEEEHGHHERSHVLRCLGERVLETGDGGEDLGDGDQDVGAGLGPNVDVNWCAGRHAVGEVARGVVAAL